MATDREINTENKLKAIRREISYRKYVYPRRIAAGSMTELQASWQVAIMEAIAEDYETKLEAEKASGDLFGRMA